MSIIIKNIKKIFGLRKVENIRNISVKQEEENKKKRKKRRYIITLIIIFSFIVILLTLLSIKKILDIIRNPSDDDNNYVLIPSMRRLRERTPEMVLQNDNTTFIDNTIGHALDRVRNTPIYQRVAGYESDYEDNYDDDIKTPL